MKSNRNLSEKTKTLPPSFPQKWESRNEKQQEFIGKKPKPFRRHSHESGNLEMKSNRNSSEMTETERTGFPLLRE
ncbi:TPA: hypothetical protein ACQUJH_000294 [Neisseria cinerea]|uniref:hypothetical protein n=1 Tax=Neisseria sp. Marseille-Q6792 TaxID=2937985 RepID=UPI0020249DA9|nr:hypothetical protein [Neisseria sp. Marseille-Q6792]